MEQNQYYCPTIGELFVGYEYEQEYFSNMDATSEGWRELTMTDVDFTSIAWALERGRIRVPFLTKEQIEAEGWDLLPLSTCRYVTADMGWRLYRITPVDTPLKDIIWRIHGEGSFGGDNYLGKIKSVNEFRKIVQWLGISDGRAASKVDFNSESVQALLAEVEEEIKVVMENSIPDPEAK